MRINVIVPCLSNAILEVKADLGLGEFVTN